MSVQSHQSVIMTLKNYLKKNQTTVQKDNVDSKSEVFKVHHCTRKQPTWLDENAGTQADLTFHIFYKKRVQMYTV